MSTAHAHSKKTLQKGIVLSIGAALLWGVSGSCAQFLFTQRGVQAEWMVTLRLLISGVGLILLARAKGLDIFKPWRNRKEALHLVLFGIFGMLGVQFTYFAAIKYSNAATATVLQYLGPVMIVAYYSLLERRLPQVLEALAILLALSGAFLLVTHGRLDSLSISQEGLFWGIASAVALALYNVQPTSLLRKYDPAVIVGWSMLIGGCVLSLLYPPWVSSGRWDGAAVAAATFIVLLGTLVAFYAYLTAVKSIGATKASVLACAEPLSATAVSVLFLGVNFGLPEWAGTFLVLSTIWILTLAKPAEMKRGPEGAP